MKVSKRGGVYWVDFRLSNGARRRITTGEREEVPAYVAAAAIVKHEEAALAAGGTGARPVSRRPAIVTLGSALDRQYHEHWRTGKSARVMYSMIQRIKADLGHLPLEACDYGALKGYCTALQKSGLANATLNRRMSAISVTLTECRRRREFLGNVDVPQFREDNEKDRQVQADEEAKLLGWLDGKAAAEGLDPEGAGEWAFMRALYVFLVDTGMRFSEAFLFIPEGTRAFLPKHVTKTGKDRLVPLSPRAQVASEAMRGSPWYLKLRDMGADGGRAHWDWCSHRMGRACKAVGVEGVTLHTLRHTCATRLLQNGLPIYEVSKWLGHSSIKTTERYARFAPDGLDLGLDALDRFAAQMA